MPIIISNTATMIANNVAFQKPPTSNLAPKSESLNITINTVIIKEINPKVNQFNGNVNKRNNPPMIAFTKPMTMYELRVLDILKDNPNMTQDEIAEKLKRSVRTIKSITKSLQEKGALKRENGKRFGY